MADRALYLAAMQTRKKGDKWGGAAARRSWRTTRRACGAARAVCRGPWLRYKRAGGEEDMHEAGGMICAVLKAKVFKVIIALRRPLRARHSKIE